MLTRHKDGQDWRIGDGSEVAWIQAGTERGLTITSAVPPQFAAYATVVVSDDDGQGDQALVDVLSQHSADRAWWLGYLHTHLTDEMPFYDAPRVRLYADWDYTLVLAGPQEATTWRTTAAWQRGALPELIFPSDHSWLVSTLWDDDWRCVGGPEALIDAVVANSALDARAVELGEDATPPGHRAM